tara:strand:+ start:419 stop:847 length:429 start_codon:yes stop_codon:yes gene_type:complete
MLNTQNLYNCFLEQYNMSNLAINTIAFQLLCLEPFTEGSFTDKQLSKLIDLSINLTNSDKVNIAKKALNKAYESDLLLEDKIYYLLIAVCVTIRLQGESLTQENQSTLNVVKTQSIDYLDYVNQEYPNVIPNLDLYEEQMCY